MEKAGKTSFFAAQRGREETKLQNSNKDFFLK